MAEVAEAVRDIDPKAFWGAIGCRAAGAAIVTTTGSEGPSGFLGLSATHLTASPPTMMVSIDRRTSACADILASGVFAINYLARSGLPIFERFASRDGPKGTARFEGLALRSLATGAPILPGIVGVLDCRLDEAIERHGVVIAIGRIAAFESVADAEPLIHYQGRVLA
ncbi:MAG: flavin reductase [Dechloromonas sp.]|nr:flavin reductase [Dechloromonas sp.]